MGLPELRADCKLQRERILGSKLPATLKSELADNLWPFLEALLEENLGMDDAIAELIDQSENVLQPEFAAAIVGALELGKLICNEVDALIKDSDDDLRKKRIAGLLTDYRRAAEVVTDEVAAATVDMEPEEDEEPEDEDDTPVEIPKPPAPDDEPEVEPDADDDDPEAEPIVEEDEVAADDLDDADIDDEAAGA